MLPVSAPVTYRRFRPGDEVAINAGFELAFHTRRELGEWHWKYQADADARAVYVAVTRDGRVLADLYFIREWLLVDGREFRVAQTVDVYALPEARRSLAGASVYLETAKAFFREYLAPHDLAAVYGFPGPRHEPLLVRHLDCVRVQPVKVWVRAADRRWPWRTAHDVRSGWDPAAIDEVWRRASPRYPVALRRDAARLTRRFTGRPGVRYEQLTAWRRGAPHAIAVLRAGGGETVLADLLWDGGDPRALVAVQRAASSLARAAGDATMTAWLDGDAACERVLGEQRWLCRPHPDGIGLVVRLDHPELTRELLAGRFYVTAADADLV